MDIYPYKLRITTWDDEIILGFLTKYAVRYVYVKEHINNENQHTHFYFETTHENSAIRAYIRRNIGTGVEHYSMNILDSILPMEYLRYLCKQDTLKSNFLTEEQIQEYKELETKFVEELKEKKKRGASKAVINDLRAIIDAQVTTYEKFGKEQIEFPLHKGSDGTDQIWTHEDMVFLVLDYYKEKKILVREFQVVSQVQTLLLEYNPGYKCRLANRILDKI